MLIQLKISKKLKLLRLNFKKLGTPLQKKCTKQHRKLPLKERLLMALLGLAVSAGVALLMFRGRAKAARPA